MTIYVDAAIHPWRGRFWCHLFTDIEDLEELHRFARRLGLKRHWFQEPPKASWRHYDITREKRFQAVKLGAVECDHWKTLEVAYGKKHAKKVRRRYELSVRSRQASEGE